MVEAARTCESQKKSKKSNVLKEIYIMYIDKNDRAKLGKQMDDYLRENINDEEIFWNVWASIGVSDGATEDDYEDLEDDDEFWTDCLEAFMRCVLLDNDYNDG